MYCPMKFAASFEFRNDDCDQEKCAWWNERYCMCCQAVGAYLEGIEDYKLEKDQYGD